MKRSTPALVLSPEFVATTTHVTCYGMTVPRYVYYLRDGVECILDIGAPEYHYVPRAVFLVKNFFRDTFDSLIPFGPDVPPLPFHRIFFQYYSIANGVTKENFFRFSKAYSFWMAVVSDPPADLSFI